MASISSNSLFHFTDTPEKLFSVLTHEFLPRFSLQEFDFRKGNPTKAAFPMVCFCDIPLSQIGNHIDTYGYYGIGMNKEWGEKNKLNPILYLRKNSRLSDKTTNLFLNVQHEEFLMTPLLQKSKREILDLFRYIKPYKGDFYRNGRKIKDVTFYNEREWRYIPETNNNEPIVLFEQDFKNELTRTDANNQLEQYKLKFEPSDIKYIFLKSENEIGTMIKALKRIKSKYDTETIEILTSRITTCEQIVEDI
jgi:hypothetical protein